MFIVEKMAEKESKDCFEMNVPLKMTFVRPFLAIFLPYNVHVFHKTEVLTVILRCLTGLTYDWFKVISSFTNANFA